jgi:hypothetical protein
MSIPLRSWKEADARTGRPVPELVAAKPELASQCKTVRKPHAGPGQKGNSRIPPGIEGRFQRCHSQTGADEWFETSGVPAVLKLHFRYEQKGGTNVAAGLKLLARTGEHRTRFESDVPTEIDRCANRHTAGAADA